MNWKNEFPEENRYFETENGILYCGDCLEIMKKFPKNKIDLIITDPPYDISVTNKGGSINKIKKFNNSTKQVAEAKINNGYNFEEFIRIAEGLQNKLSFYVFCNKKQIPMYINYFYNKKNILFDIIIWNKKNAIPSYYNKYLTDCEYCLYFKQKGAYNKPQNYEDAKTVYLGTINHKDKKKYKHPTIKPLDLVEKLIRNSCPEGGIVLDTFIGSGTTAVAREKVGKKWIGIEINKEYCEIAKKRLLENK